MTDQRDTPDTRTPSAEGCGHYVHRWNEERRWVEGQIVRDGWWEPCPGQGSDAPSAPNRAPTDALAKMRAAAYLIGWSDGSEWKRYDEGEAEIRGALEDLTRENERLRYERDDFRRLWARRNDQVAAARALCDDSRQVLWPSAHGYPSGWTLDPAAVLAALDTASEDRGDSQGAVRDG